MTMSRALRQGMSCLRTLIEWNPSRTVRRVLWSIPTAGREQAAASSRRLRHPHNPIFRSTTMPLFIISLRAAVVNRAGTMSAFRCHQRTPRRATILPSLARFKLRTIFVRPYFPHLTLRLTCKADRGQRPSEDSNVNSKYGVRIIDVSCNSDDELNPVSQRSSTHSAHDTTLRSFPVPPGRTPLDFQQHYRY